MCDAIEKSSQFLSIQKRLFSSLRIFYLIFLHILLFKCNFTSQKYNYFLL